ncbi:uncharacterized protein LOC133018881 [Limanda limanda]|uniref:uncharacterized protein LOC133018881 n=1 Tax=Limanda limanda TaxID=27771 RepID=UPI0029C7093D|nr:uncharacterized protein LOC133018881 [Limanda limanda]XP_060941186.1 uncharacterized protein LOC133018881 [Limanda limanda]
MILTGRSLCLPSPGTVQELFSVARDASIIPDISLDPVLTTFLSLDSSAALQHQHAFIQRSMSREQRTEFSLSLTRELGGSRVVTYGGVGVVALALSLLFDQIAQQVRTEGSTEGDLSTQRPQDEDIFGISTSSRIGRIIYSYLCLIPEFGNNEEKMAETTELYDRWLKLELIDHFERMTKKKRMSSVSMQQWLTGAAFHLHMRIHQVRLHSVPLGSAESLRLSYKSGIGLLVQGYTAYLRRNTKETAPGSQKPTIGTTSRPRQTKKSKMTNKACSGNRLFNVSQVSTSISTDGLNKTTATNSTADGSRNCETHGTTEEFGVSVSKGSNETTVSMGSIKTLTNVTEYNREEEASMLGLLVIEPGRNVSHNVQHHPCESPAIQQALVTRVINAQDLERNRNVFLFPEKVLRSLCRQRNDIEFKAS